MNNEFDNEFAPKIKLLSGASVSGHGCPFCGGNSHVVTAGKYDFDVSCNGEINEECRGTILEENFKTGWGTEQYAIDAWNKRFSL